MKTKRQIPTHSFFIEDAEKYGLTCAVLLMHIRYWMDENRYHNINFHDGRYWTFSSVKNLQEKFPYLSERQISVHLLKLEQQGVLISGNYNKSTYDRTKWYSLIEEIETEQVEKTVVTISQNGEMEHTEKSDSILQNGKMDKTEMQNGTPQNVQPIPLIKEINKEIKKEGGQKEKFLPPTLNQVILFFQKENIKASAENFFNHWESVGWKKSRGQQIFNWQSLVPKWVENEFVKTPAQNAPPKKAGVMLSPKRKQEVAEIFEAFKKRTREFVEQLQTDSSALETARIKFDQECNHAFEFKSQAIYTEIGVYQTAISTMPHLVTESDLQNISLQELNTLTFNQFKRNFFEWFKKQKHTHDLFSETPNKAHRPAQLQNN